MNPPLSAIIITHNESRNLGRCLNSLLWVDEVIIVDSFSTDNTVEIATKFANTKVIKHEWLGFVGSKNIALQHTSHDWVFWIDADEEVSPLLQKEIVYARIHSEDCSAFDFPRKTFFLNKWVKHSGWYPGRIVRIFNKKHCVFSENILHESIVVSDNRRIEHLKNDLLHYSYDNLYQYFDKMNKYGMYGAEEMLRRKKKFKFWQLIVNPLHTFFRFYFIEKGFLDGYLGLIISIGSAFYNFIKYTNFYYLSKNTEVSPVSQQQSLHSVK